MSSTLLRFPCSRLHQKRPSAQVIPKVTPTGVTLQLDCCVLTGDWMDFWLALRSTKRTSTFTAS
jgi:hypothetical protein